MSINTPAHNKGVFTAEWDAQENACENGHQEVTQISQGKALE